MIEEGEVIKVEGEKVIISLPASQHCKKCGICVSATDGRRMLEISKDKKVKVGDKVEVSIPEGIVSRISFLLFILPLLVFILGYGLLRKLTGSEVISGVGAGIGFLLVLYGIWLYEKRIREIKGTTLSFVFRVKGKNGSDNS